GMKTNFAGLKHAVHHTSETGHGRTDERTCQYSRFPRPLATPVPAGSAHPGGRHLAPRRGRCRDVGVATVHPQSRTAREVAGDGRASALNAVKPFTLKAGSTGCLQSMRRCRRKHWEELAIVPYPIGFREASCRCATRVRRTCATRSIIS